MRRKTISLLLLSCFSVSFCQPQKTNLKEEVFIHPADASTAYTLEKGKFIYNQSLTPYPSWAWWGISSWMTAELDFEAWLGGVPSLNIRMRLARQTGTAPSLAYETMYQYIHRSFDQMSNLSHLNIIRRGSSWYHRINASWQVRHILHIHTYAGLTFAQDLSIENSGKDAYSGSSFSDMYSPDAGLGVDVRTGPGMALCAAFSYGATFLYADNIPRKIQWSIGMRAAPFLQSNLRVLNRLRFEISFISVAFVDAGQSFAGPIGFLYWHVK